MGIMRANRGLFILCLTVAQLPIHGSAKARHRFSIAHTRETDDAMNAIKTAVEMTVDLLVRDEYMTLDKVTRSRRLTANQISSAIFDIANVRPGHSSFRGEGPLDVTDASP